MWLYCDGNPILRAVSCATDDGVEVENAGMSFVMMIALRYTNQAYMRDLVPFPQGQFNEPLQALKTPDPQGRALDQN